MTQQRCTCSRNYIINNYLTSRRIYLLIISPAGHFGDKKGRTHRYYLVTGVLSAPQQSNFHLAQNVYIFSFPLSGKSFRGSII